MSATATILAFDADGLGGFEEVLARAAAASAHADDDGVDRVGVLWARSTEGKLAAGSRRGGDERGTLKELAA